MIHPTKVKRKGGGGKGGGGGGGGKSKGGKSKKNKTVIGGIVETPKAQYKTWLTSVVVIVVTVLFGILGLWYYLCTVLAFTASFVSRSSA